MIKTIINSLGVFCLCWLSVSLSAAEFKSGEYSVWIPDANTPVRGVLVHRTYGGGSQLASRASWRIFAEKIGIGHVVIPQKNKVPVSIAQGAKDVKNLNDFLKKAAKQFNRKELVNSPFIALGISRGGANAIAMACAAKNQGIAGMGYHGISVTDIGSSIALNPNLPVYYTMASLDKPSKKRNVSIEMYVRKQMRNQGGFPWTLKVDYGVKHASQPDDPIVFSWIEEVVAMRLGKKETLRPVNFNKSWLGAYQAIHLSDSKLDFINTKIHALKSMSDLKSEFVWLPGETTAKHWHEYHNKKKRKMETSASE